MELVFKVRRNEAEVVKPAKATPQEVKSLSDWDDRTQLRCGMPCILFYKSAATLEDPAETIKKALAEALVYYYPLAGRLKEEGEEKKLVVDCTAEGVVFISAYADVRLDQFEPIHPPFPCVGELLYREPYDFTEPLGGCPLFLMQVTRLACGGFILAFTMSHVVSDLRGQVQFVTAISELARGAPAPTVLPVWQRQLLNRTASTQSGHVNMLYGHNPDEATSLNKVQSDPSRLDDMTYASFFFGPQELEAIRARLSRDHHSYSSFELISACVFHCRALSLSLDQPPEQKVRAIFTVNASSKFANPPLPPGFYGNASFAVIIIRPMQSFHSLQYVVEEVRKAKDAVTEDYARSAIEGAATARSSGSVTKNSVSYPTYIISDLSRTGLSCLDFGWGDPVYAGTTDDGAIVNSVSFMVAYTNANGEDGRLITLYMPQQAMDKFALTLRTFLASST